MAEAEIDAMLSKKYADLEADFAALLGPSLLAPAQAEQVKVAFDLSSQAEIAKVLEARGGADPNAVAAIRARTNTKLESFLKQYDAPAKPNAQVLSDAQLSDMLKDLDTGQNESRKRADSRIQDEYRRRSVALSNAPAPAAGPVSISSNKSALPGGFKAGGLTQSSEGAERARTTGTMISPRKRGQSEVDNAKRLSLFEAQLMEETERARAMMAEQAKARETQAAAAAMSPVSPRPGPTVRQEIPAPDPSAARSISPTQARRSTANQGFVTASQSFMAAPAAEARRGNAPPSVADYNMRASISGPPGGGTAGAYRPPTISGSAAVVRSSSPHRRSIEPPSLPEMKRAPQASSFDEPLLIDSYHALPDNPGGQDKGRNCQCTIV